MSKTEKSSRNRPFKLQFGSGAPQPLEEEPKLAPTAENVDDEFVFNNSAQLRRELRLQTKSDAAPVEAVTPAEPPAKDTPPSANAPEKVDNILDPDWDADDPSEVSEDAAPIPAPVLDPVLAPVQTVPPPPPATASVSEFGYVLPEDPKPKRAGVAAYAGLAAGVVLALGALGGAWTQMRPGADDTDVATSDETPVETVVAKADPQPETVQADPEPAQQADTAVARLAPSAPDAPTIESAATAPIGLPQRTSGPTSGDVSPSPTQPDLARLPEAEGTLSPNRAPVASPEQPVIASDDAAQLPSQRSVSTLARPDLGAAPRATTLARPEGDLGQTASVSAPTAPDAQAQILPGPLPKRATDRPSLGRPTLPISVDGAPSVVTAARQGMTSPRTPDATTQSPEVAADTAPARAVQGQAPLAISDGVDFANVPQNEDTSPAPNVHVDMTSGAGLPAPSLDVAGLPDDLTPARPAEPTGPTRAELTTPVLLAASAQIIGQTNGNRDGAGERSYAASDLAPPALPRLLPITLRGFDMPSSGPLRATTAPRAHDVVRLASVAAPLPAPGTRADELVTAPVQTRMPALQAPIEGTLPTIDLAAGPLAAPGQAAALASPSDAGSRALPAFDLPSLPPAQIAVADLGSVPVTADASFNFSDLSVPAMPPSAAQLGSAQVVSNAPTIPQGGQIGAVQFQVGAAFSEPGTDTSPTGLAPLQMVASVVGVMPLADASAPDAADLTIPTRPNSQDPIVVAVAVRAEPDVADARAQARPRLLDRKRPSSNAPTLETSWPDAYLSVSVGGAADRPAGAPAPTVAAPEPVADASVPDEKPAATGPALVFLGAAQPQGQATAETQEKIESALPAFVKNARWIADFPGELTDEDGVVGILTSDIGSPVWVQSGAVILAVDGNPVPDLDAWTSLVNDRTNEASGVASSLALTVQSPSGDVTEHTISLPVARSVEFADGTRIETHRVRGKWKTRVAEISGSNETDLQPGDVLLFDFTTREKLNAPTAFEVMTRALADEDTGEVVFAIVRDGALDNATFPLPTP